MARQRIPVRRDEDGSIYLSWDWETYVDGVPVKLLFAESSGRIVCTRVEIGEPFDGHTSDPSVVTTSTLRIPLARMIDEALMHLARQHRMIADQAKNLYELGRDENVAQVQIADGYTPEMFEESQSRLNEVADAAEATVTDPGRKPGRPPKYDDDHWRNVLKVYRAHGGRAPRKAVAEYFGINVKNAGKWVKKATDREQMRLRNP